MSLLNQDKHMEEKFSELSHALLCMQNALLSAVVPELRAVIVHIEEQTNTLFHVFFYDCEVTDILFDLASVASMEAYEGDYGTNMEIMRLDAPQEIPIRGWLAYLRREVNPWAQQLQRPQVKREMQRKACELFQADQGKMIEKRFAKLVKAQLCMQIALLGVVVPSLRAVTVDVDIESNKVFHAFFYEGEVTEELFALAKEASIEASINLSGYVTDTSITRLDQPNEIPCRGRFVYRRKEDR